MINLETTKGNCPWHATIMQARPLALPNNVWVMSGIYNTSLLCSRKRSTSRVSAPHSLEHCPLSMQHKSFGQLLSNLQPVPVNHNMGRQAGVERGRQPGCSDIYTLSSILCTFAPQLPTYLSETQTLNQYGHYVCSRRSRVISKRLP